MLDAVDAIPVPVWVADRFGRLRWLNAAAASLFGNRFGAHFSRLIGPEVVATVRELFARKVNGILESTVQSVTLKRVEGEIDAELVSVPVRRGRRSSA